ncbi:MAG: hypothetical protein C3F02_01905 [Parcubacteria group bacterium]|nr:MAG: hypothetical protein C3F02_01905 [Parcubacteria group bacterium]
MKNMSKYEIFNKAKKLIILILLGFPLVTRAVSLPNPLRSNIDSVPALANNIIKGLLGVSGSLALFFLVWGGIVWMTSGGNSDRVRKGKDTIVWAILGLGIIFLSYAIINLLLTILRG